MHTDHNCEYHSYDSCNCHCFYSSSCCFAIIITIILIIIIVMEIIRISNYSTSHYLPYHNFIISLMIIILYRQHFAAMCEKEGWTETIPKLIHVTPKELVPKQGTYRTHVRMFDRTHVRTWASTCVSVRALEGRGNI